MSSLVRFNLLVGFLTCVYQSLISPESDSVKIRVIGSVSDSNVLCSEESKIGVYVMSTPVMLGCFANCLTNSLSPRIVSREKFTVKSPPLLLKRACSK